MKITSFLTVFLALWVYPAVSQAYWGDHHGAGYHGSHSYYHYHDHPHFGVHVGVFYPDEYYPVWVGGARYYYDDGVYYDYTGGSYVVVAPPTGAVVTTIPSDFQPLVVNGTTYYTNNGTYYVYTNKGYQVVAAPVQTGGQKAFTVNVPRDKGGYAAIIIRKSGNGFVGPQGEFYDQFPKVSQLQIMYGR